jgi:sugar phosphate isomerase/epimerase
MWQQGMYSLAYLTVNGADPLQHIAAAAQAGYQAAGLRILPPRHLADAPSVVGNVPLIRAIKHACSGSGISLLDAEVVSITATTTGSELQAVVDTAAELGFSFIQTVVEDSEEARAADRLAALADLAAAAQMRIALEFMRFRPLTDLQSALRLIQMAGRSNVQVLIDALHLARSGGSTEQVAALAPDSIALAQLCDAPAEAPAIDQLAQEARTARLYPGDGALPLSALLDVLPDGTPLSIEVPNTAYESLDFTVRARRALDATEALCEAHRLGSMNIDIDKKMYRNRCKEV